MKKIDAHLHVAKVLAGYCRRGELRAAGGGKAMWGNGEVFQLIPPEYGDTDFLMEKAMEIMERNGVEKAVLMQGSMYGFQNQYHMELMKKYPDTICPSCTVDPYMTNHLETLTSYLKEGGFRLVKFEVSSGGGLMGCHDTFSLVSDRMMEIYKLIEDCGGVLALDVGDAAMPSHQPESLLKISESFPKLKLVICHTLAPTDGITQQWEKSLQMLKRDNVWFDLAAMPKIMGLNDYPFAEACNVVRRAADIVGIDRLMWGTDAPFATTIHTYEQLTNYLIESKMFTESELEDLFYNNAQKVYFD